MTRARVSKAIVGALALAGAWCPPAIAETVALSCAANAVLDTREMTLVYDGDDVGTLTVTGPFGEMRLPATRESREGTDETGQPLAATGIRASGQAAVSMPDKAALEACVTGKLPADQLTDADIVFVTLMGCAAEVPAGAAPVEVVASVEIALTPLVYVGLTRTYAEPTGLVVGTIAIEAYPDCRIEE